MTSRNNKKKSSTSYERRAAMQRQLDAMEAEASGTRPSMNIDMGDEGEFVSVRQRNQETARRFLYDEDDEAAGVLTSKNKNTTMAAANLFGNRGPETGGVNLMDHETGIYSNEDHSFTGRIRRFFLGDVAHQPGEHDAIAADSEVYLGEQARASRSSSIFVRLRHLLCSSHQRVLVCLIFFTAFFMAAFFSVHTFGNKTTPEQQLRSENSDRFNDLLDLITLEGVSDMNTFLVLTSPQSRALRWVAYSDQARLEPGDPVMIQRYALAVFFYNSFMVFEKMAGAQAPIEKGEDDQFEGVPIAGWYIQDYWLTEKGICYWHGIECAVKNIGGIEKRTYDENAPIYSFNMTNNYVWGDIPNEIKALHSIERLDLSGNRLQGKFPSEVRRLTKLKYIKLQHNKMTGSLPIHIGFMQSAIELDISKNKFSGSIPTEINRLSNIRILDFSNNVFTNQFPMIRNLKELRYLHLGSNELSGTVPFSLAETPEVREVYLEKNKLTGTIAPEMETLSKLRIFSAYDNKISGNFPNYMFYSNEELEQVSIQFNSFTGSIPTFAGRLRTLHTLQMHDNDFTGTFPSEWQFMTSLRILHLQNNRMHGSLPPTVNKFPVLKELWISHNDLTGAIPPEFSESNSLEQLYLDHNKLQGQIPPEMSQMAKLETLRLEENAITGSVPDEVCNMKTFQLRFMSMDCVNEITCPDNCCNKCY